MKGHLANHMRTELRRFERFAPKMDVTVGVLYPPEESAQNLIGSLVDISRCGLAFRYLPLDTVQNITGEYCKVHFLKRPMTISPISCRIIYEVESDERGMFLPCPKRVGLEFIGELSDSELESIVSA